MHTNNDQQPPGLHLSARGLCVWRIHQVSTSIIPFIYEEILLLLENQLISNWRSW